jgi:hypothetical protein
MGETGLRPVMNVLDENIIASQREQLRRWRIPFRQIGHEVANSGAKDPEIVPLLLRLKHPSFFTRDFDFFVPRLCHRRYCLAWLNVPPAEAALFIRRFLSHPDFCTRQQRQGKVARIHPQGVEYWQCGQSGKVARNWLGKSRL